MEIARKTTRKKPTPVRVDLTPIRDAFNQDRGLRTYYAKLRGIKPYDLSYWLKTGGSGHGNIPADWLLLILHDLDIPTASILCVSPGGDSVRAKIKAWKRRVRRQRAIIEKEGE